MVSNEVKYISQLKSVNSNIIPFDKYNPKQNYPENFTLFQCIKKVSLNATLVCTVENESQINITEDKYASSICSIKYNDIDEVLSILHDIFLSTISNICKTSNDNNIGIALSGGVDSSLIAAYVKYNSKINLHSYTVGTGSKNEFYYAKLCSEYIGATHHEIIIDQEMLIQGIIKMIYFNEMHDVYVIEVYSSLDAIYQKCNKHSNILLTGIGADCVFSNNNQSYKNMVPSFLDLSRVNWSGLSSPYKSEYQGIIEYTPFYSTRLLSFINNICPKMQDHNNTNKYLLKMLADRNNLLPKENIWREKLRFEQGIASDKMFADFLEIEPNDYQHKHKYTYEAFRILFAEKVPVNEFDPYDIKRKIKE